MLSKDCLSQLGISINAPRSEIESSLDAQEARCRVLLKIPTKRAEGESRLGLIAAAREIIKKSPAFESDNAFDFTDDYEEIFEDGGGKVPETEKTSEEIYETAPITDEGGLGDIRRKLNQWASAIPNHDYPAFGNLIKIISAERRPIYLIHTAVLVEKRVLVERETPYQGEKVPANTVFDKESVSVWEVRLPEKNDFGAQSAEHQLPQSRRRADCARCEKRGESWCGNCQSTGMVLCPECKGSNQSSCANCKGSGSIEDRRAGIRLIDCSQCNGAGVAVCRYCRDGWMRCDVCKGYRKISCPDCSGKGELLISFCIKADYRSLRSDAVVFSTDFPDYAAKKFDPSRFAKTARRALSIEDRDGGIPEEINEIGYEALRLKAEDASARSKNEIAVRNERICKRLIEILSCSAVRVQYSFEEKNYELWILGEQGEICCRTSPIHEYDQKLSRLASTALEAGDMETCIERLAPAFRHSSHSAAGLVVLNNCVKKLEEENQKGRFTRISAIADLVETMLGSDLAASFIALRKRSRRMMRIEYAAASLSAGAAVLIALLLYLSSSGETYAWNVTLISGAALLPTATALFAFLLAPVLTNRGTRIITASAIGTVAVVAGAIVGLIVQSDYLSSRKREAMARFGRGDYESAKSAIEPLEAAVKASPRDFQLQLMLGRAYVRASNYEKAIQSLAVAVELSGGRDAEAHNEMGFALYGKGDEAQAIEHFRKAIALRRPEIYSDAFRNLARALRMGYLEGGSISAGGVPSRRADLKPFLLDRFEITNRQYFEFVKAAGRKPPSEWKGDGPPDGTEELPVTGVSMEDARAFALWRSEREGFLFRLPSEDEWEFSVRGAKNRLFPWGDEFKENYANLRGAEGRLRPVGSFPRGASPEGLEDLIGNAAEWAESGTSDKLCTARGGSYAVAPEQAGSGLREILPATGGDYRRIGFRCALSADAIK